LKPNHTDANYVTTDVKATIYLIWFTVGPNCFQSPDGDETSLANRKSKASRRDERERESERRTAKPTVPGWPAPVPLTLMLRGESRRGLWSGDESRSRRDKRGRQRVESWRDD